MNTNVSLKRAGRRRRDGRTYYVWQLRWHGRDGKHYCRSIGHAGQVSKREAERARRELQGKLDHGIVKPDRNDRLTLSQFIGLFLLAV